MSTESNPIYTPPGGPPQNLPVSKDIYPRMGEANIFRMCRDFYAELENSPIRSMFPDDMAAASEKLAAFLVGLCGGPPLYHERYGPPMMRRRHFHVAIDEQAKNIWLECFFRILEKAEIDYGFPVEHKAEFKRFLEGFAGWMVNRPPG